MATYIDREAYRNRLADLESWCQDLRKPGLKQALEMFDEVPAADAVEVVRRKDCKYSSGTKKCLNPDSFFAVPKDDDFCSYGERKDGGAK
nr:MAG TPA: hypothetical protein [Caudoviricetes sp.]